MITARVRVNKSNGQKTLTVPKKSHIYRNDLVMLTKLEDPTQMNNDKEVQDNERDSTRNDRGIGYDPSPSTNRE